MRIEKSRELLILETVAATICKDRLDDEQIHVRNHRGWVIQLDIANAEAMCLKRTMVTLSEGELLVAQAIADAMTHLDDNIWHSRGGW